MSATDGGAYGASSGFIDGAADGATRHLACLLGRQDDDNMWVTCLFVGHWSVPLLEFCYLFDFQSWMSLMLGSALLSSGCWGSEGCSVQTLQPN